MKGGRIICISIILFSLGTITVLNKLHFSVQDTAGGGASAPVRIFEDKGGALPVGDKINQENIKKPGQWTKAKVRQKTVGVVPVEDVDKFQKPVFSGKHHNLLLYKLDAS